MGGDDGGVGLELTSFRHSSDKRAALTWEQLKCVKTLFELPESWMQPREVVPPGRETGGIYSGFSLGSLALSFLPPAGEISELVSLPQGLSLRHRGRGEPCFLEAGT